MRKVLVLALAVALGAGVAYANFCARDYVPAATLLVPYAKVGLTLGMPDPAKVTTLFSITNVSSAATIVHITMWDARSNPEIDFDVILSGYDTWQVNFRDVLAGRFDLFDTGSGSGYNFWVGTTGTRPFEWGPDGKDANNPNAYPAGNLPALPDPQDTDHSSITGACPTPPPPYHDLSSLAPQIIAKFTDVLVAYSHNGCTKPVRADLSSWTTSLTADPVFFYVTADVSVRCSTDFPNSAGYWSGANPTGGFNNVLIGDFIYFDPVNNYSVMYPAVSLEADAQWEGGAASGLPYETFYGVQRAKAEALTPPVFPGNDAREPLGTAFAFRYMDEPAMNLSSAVTVWKNDTEFVTVGGTVRVNDCGRYIYYAWDHNEHSLSRTAQGGPSGFEFTDVDPNQFPFETQQVQLTKNYFDIYRNLGAGNNNIGWMMLIFPPSYGFAQPNSTLTYDPLIQAWVGYEFRWQTGSNSFATGIEAATLANAHCFANQTLPNALGINFNYNGTTTDGYKYNF
ncbi:MAG: hypothetical protein QXN56_02895 [Candidatus Hadarchaeum sp.]